MTMACLSVPDPLARFWRISSDCPGVTLSKVGGIVESTRYVKGRIAGLKDSDEAAMAGDDTEAVAIVVMTATEETKKSLRED